MSTPTQSAEPNRRSEGATRFAGIVLGFFVLTVAFLVHAADSSSDEALRAAQTQEPDTEIQTPGKTGEPKQAEPKGDAPKAGDPATGDTTKPGDITKPPSVEPDARGFIRLGTVRFHPKDKVIEADGWFNLDRGIVEFLACAPGVKAHETLISLDLNPTDLNLALIALGLKAGKPPKHDADLRPIAGDRVMIFLKFHKKNEAGKKELVVKRAEDCLINYLAEEDMERVGFVYTGSQFIPKDPLAPPGNPNDPATEARLRRKKKGDEEGEAKGADGKPTPKVEMVYAPIELGQYIALCHRPFAILDNPLQLPYPDPEYGANPMVLPLVTRAEDEFIPVTLIIRKPKPGEIDYSIKRMPFKMPEPRESEPPKVSDDEDDGGR